MPRNPLPSLTYLGRSTPAPKTPDEVLHLSATTADSTRSARSRSANASRRFLSPPIYASVATGTPVEACQSMCFGERECCQPMYGYPSRGSLPIGAADNVARGSTGNFIRFAAGVFARCKNPAFTHG
jgi:hypothetical protein